MLAQTYDGSPYILNADDPFYMYHELYHCIKYLLRIMQPEYVKTGNQKLTYEKRARHNLCYKLHDFSKKIWGFCFHTVNRGHRQDFEWN